jgi:hypothetical protein
MLWDLLAELRRKVKRTPVEDVVPARTLPLDRELTEEERAIAVWLLTHGGPIALSYLPQLEGARVIGSVAADAPPLTSALRKEFQQESQRRIQLAMRSER